jgi:isopenicillin N synthase-like dioxygenase
MHAQCQAKRINRNSLQAHAASDNSNTYGWLWALLWRVLACWQVLAQDDTWVPVHPSAQQLVVLVGHTLHWATAGRLPAAQHRIVMPASVSSSSGAPRLSLAFKLRAAADAEFDPAVITGTASSRLDCRCAMAVV